ncbi:multiple coagulation factor deficiency protein 2 homolog isoform X1 [Styela clava]
MKITIFTFVVATFVVAGTLADEFQFDPDSDESKVHLQEDLAGHIDKKVEEMNQDELQFHYFRQHDYDKNERLDGNELMMSITHHQHSGSGETEKRERTFSDDQLDSIIGEILKRHDKDNDGMMSFKEYVAPLREMKKGS